MIPTDLFIADGTVAVKLTVRFSLSQADAESAEY